MLDVESSPISVAAERSSSLQKDILRTLLYFDIFNHPLTAKEIYSFLPSNSTTASAVEQACSSEPLHEVITHEGPYFRLRSAGEDIVADRRTKESRAARLWRIAVFMSHIIRRFPFVRAVFVSGELSKGVASQDSDIDFVIVTAEGRLWICRTLLILFKKMFLLNSKKFFCLNHFVSADHLEAEDRNVYTATEIATLQPLYNLELFRQYQRVNEWIQTYLPNASTISHSPIRNDHRRLLMQRFLESLILSSVADKVDPWLLQRWKMVWRKRYPELPTERRSRLFKSSLYLSTAYGQDFLTQILTRYRDRLEQSNLLSYDHGLSN
ncbi:MAG: hypothetical protein WBD36_02635 [Bacteroidota bacterium]